MVPVLLCWKNEEVRGCKKDFSFFSFKYWLSCHFTFIANLMTANYPLISTNKMKSSYGLNPEVSFTAYLAPTRSQHRVPLSLEFWSYKPTHLVGAKIRLFRTLLMLFFLSGVLLSITGMCSYMEGTYVKYLVFPYLSKSEHLEKKLTLQVITAILCI